MDRQAAVASLEMIEFELSQIREAIPDGDSDAIDSAFDDIEMHLQNLRVFIGDDKPVKKINSK